MNPIVEATSAAGAVETFTASATDLVDGSSDPVVFTEELSSGATRVVQSGDTFGIGSHTIIASAIDAAGNTGLAAPFTFSVVDTTPPAVTASATAPTVEATSAGGAVETFTGSASDLVDGSSDPVVYTDELAGGATQVVQSGDTFGIGSHTIVASATDAAGNTGSATPFTFTVHDTTAPVVTATASPVVAATGEAGAAVSFAASSSDAVDGASDAITFTEVLAGGLAKAVASGDLFAPGLHTVVASATDAAGNTGASAAFTFDVVAKPVLSAFWAVLGASTSAGTQATFTGTVSDAGSTVALYNGPAIPANLIGNATVLADGTWSLVTTLSGGQGSSVQAVATNVAGTDSLTAPFALQTGITGQPYTSKLNVIGADGRIASITFTTATGATYAVASYAADRSFTMDHPGVTGAFYTDLANHYTAAGVLTGVTYGGITGQPYVAYTVAYAPGTQTTASITSLRADGSVYAVTSYAADRSFTIDHPGVTGAFYTDLANHYSAAGFLTGVTYGGITGQPYVAYTVAYAPGTLATASITSLRADGSVYAVTSYAADRSFTIDHPGVTGAFYTDLANHYSAAGVLIGVTYGGITGQAYTAYTDAYAPGTQSIAATTYLRADGSVYAVATRLPDGNLALAHPGIVGQAYTALVNTYTPAGVLVGSSYTGYTGAYDTSDSAFATDGSPVFQAYLKAGVVTATKSWTGGSVQQTSYAAAGGGVTNAGLFEKAGTADSWSVDSGFSNSGTVKVASGSLALTQGAANSGLIDVGAHATVAVSGDLTGTGAVDLHGAGSLFEIGGASSDTISFTDTAAATLLLDDGAAFAGKLQGFGTQSMLDLKGFSGASSVSYAANQSQTGGVLTVSDANHQASLAFVGSYTSFSHTPDQTTGLLVKMVA